MLYIQVFVFVLALHLATVSSTSSDTERNLLELDLKLTIGNDSDQLILDGKKCCTCSETKNTTVKPSTTPVVTLIPGGGVDVPGALITSDVQVYSPDGKCNYKLASLPMPLGDAATSYHNGKILLCGGSTNNWGTINRACWNYDPAKNAWIPFLPGLQYQHPRTPSAKYGNKFYVLNNGNQNEAFDFSLEKWVSWKQIPTSAGEGSCMVSWRDTLIVFGGMAHQSGVQLYNITTDSWIKKGPMPQPRAYFGCIALPNNPDKILIVGSWISDKKTVHIYDAKTDAWTVGAPSRFERAGTGLVNLNGRIFAFGMVPTNNGQNVEEYQLSNGSWTFVQVPLLYSLRHAQPIVVPASLLAPYIPGGCTGI